MHIQNIAQRFLKRNKPQNASSSIVPRPTELSLPLQAPTMVLLDDNEMFLNLLSAKLSKKRKVDSFQNPHHFLELLSAYPKNTIICFDYDFKLPDIDGIQLGIQLYQQGYTRLYMVSGMSFGQDQYPSYITLVDKCKVDLLDDLI